MYRPIGTACFVAVPAVGVEDAHHTFLITARHVAVHLDGHDFGVRLNLKVGGSMVARGDASVRWWYHPDPVVDVAAIWWSPPDTIDYRTVPLEMLLTEEARRASEIDVGDEVYVTGLFSRFAGEKQNLPIVRTGSIAMVPDEPVPTAIGPMSAYLIESRSIGGLSGSPVFVREPRDIGFGRLFLLGLVHGHWDLPPTMKNDAVDVTAGSGTAVNMGIAIVIPAQRIREVLELPDLQALIMADIEQYLASHAAHESSVEVNSST